MNQGFGLTLSILTPTGVILEEKSLTAINVTLADGKPLGIRPRHTPLIAQTQMGDINFRSELFKKQISLHPGLLYIRDNQATILTMGVLDKSIPFTEQQDEDEFDRLAETLLYALDRTANQGNDTYISE